MKRLVNDIEVELAPPDPDIKVTALPDRLAVRSADGTHTALAIKEGDTVHVSYRGCTWVVSKAALRTRGAKGPSSGELHAPMPGQVADVLAEEGARVDKGQKLVVIEAMKTQQAFVAPFDGVVVRIPVKKGEQVAEGALLAQVVADDSPREA